MYFPNRPRIFSLSIKLVRKLDTADEMRPTSSLEVELMSTVVSPLDRAPKTSIARSRGLKPLLSAIFIIIDVKKAKPNIIIVTAIR